MTHHNVSKRGLVHTRTAETATQVEKVIVISNHGNVGLQAQLLLGNKSNNSNMAETIVVMTAIVMEVAHHHGRLVAVAAAAATTTAATDKAVVMAVLPAVELLLGNDRITLLHLLHQAISMVMVDTQEAMELQAPDTADSLLWVLLPVLWEAPAVLVLHQV